MFSGRVDECTVGMISVRRLASTGPLGWRCCERFSSRSVFIQRLVHPGLLRRPPQMSPQVAAYLKTAEICNAGSEDLHKFAKLKVGETHVGYVSKEIGDHLSVYPDVFQYAESGSVVKIHDGLKSSEERTNAVAGVLKALCEKGVISGWRDELYPVTSSFYSEPLFLVERAAAVSLGIKAYGVHINGYSYKNGKQHMWVARRSKDKPTWPTKLDHIAAGGQPFGIGCTENVIKECGEEASIPVDLAQKAHPCGAVTYITVSEKGVKRDVLFIYDLQLPPDFVPVPCDGEVDEFMLWPVEKVGEIIRTTDDYKPNCALVIIDFLIRHGHITPDEPGYLQLLESLRAGECS